MEESRFCTNCGTKVSPGVKFCSNCGKEVLQSTNEEAKTEEETKSQDTVNFQEHIVNLEKADEKKESYNNSNNSNFNNQNYNNSTVNGNLNNKDMADFIQNNAHYYISKFEQMEMKNSSVSWNWASFLAGVWWFLYRKMYAYGFGIMAAVFVIDLIVPVVAPVLTIGVPIACGLFGNSLYKKYVQNKLQEISNMDPSMKQSAIMTKGGVNIVIPIVVLVVVIILAIILLSLGVLAAGLIGAANY